MKNIKHFAIILLCTFSNNAFTQELDLENAGKIEFQNEEDYAAFENELVKYIDWLESNSLNHPQRQNVHALIIKWAEGTPKITIDINSYIVDFSKKNSGFLVLYIGGWIKYSLQNPTDKNDKLKVNLAALNSVLDFYEKGKDFGVKKNKHIAKVLKKRKKGELESWMEKEIN